MGNVAAAGTGKCLAVGFCGQDGEGLELQRGLAEMGVDTRHFFSTPLRHTFTYGKPLVMHPDRPAEELSRLDIKNWAPTPPEVSAQVIEHLTDAVAAADAVILMEQVDHRQTGVLTAQVKAAVAKLAARSGKPFVADSRCAVDEYANVSLKINRSELLRHFGRTGGDEAPEALVGELAAKWARQLGHNVIVTLGADGILASAADGTLHRAARVPVPPPIDIVGAGDCVLANVTLALAGGADLGEAIQIANLAGAVVIKKLGTTGTATPDEIAGVLARHGSHLTK
jgi:bifunctional ADP-heptose synthase (sugar kinase/adenylyltransferase)